MIIQFLQAQQFPDRPISNIKPLKAAIQLPELVTTDIQQPFLLLADFTAAMCCIQQTVTV